MSVTALLNMTCTIKRRAAGKNASGETSGAFVDYALAVPCRYVQQEGKEQDSPSVSGVNRGKLFFEYGQDVTAKDEIADIANEDGTVVVTGAKIEKVNPDPGGERNHVECWLREVKV